MRAKIIFDYQYDHTNHTGFDLQLIPNHFESPLLKNFDKNENLGTITLGVESNYVFSEFEIKEEWLDLYPILGYEMWHSNWNNLEFHFTGRCSLSDGLNKLHPNPNVKTIREQLSKSALS
jgi:hypothetical protein